MRTEIRSPDRRSGLDTWILDDLSLSGLTVENFTIAPLESEAELRDRLGFTQIAGTQIINVGGYWIPYPGVPNYYRLKLKEPIKTDSGTVKYLSPKGGGNHPYVLPEVRKLLTEYKPDRPVFLSEGEKKTVRATLEGFPCIGLSGVWNWKDGENDFLPELDGCTWENRTVYIVFDSDITEKHSVRHAELRLAIELTNRGAKVLSVRLPSEPDGGKNGLDDFLVRYGAEAFRFLVDQAKPIIDLHIEEGIDASLLLKEAARLNNEITKAKIIKALAKREGVSMDAVESEYRKYLPKKEGAERIDAEVFTDDEIAKAKILLASPDILGSVCGTIRKAGVVGEERNVRTIILSSVSRLGKESLSILHKGPSSSGKSFVDGTVLRTVPKDRLKSYSLLSPKALVHSDVDLSHCVLFIQEQQGGEQSDYSIRTTLSEGEISMSYPIKDPVTGEFKSIEKRVKAEGLVFIQTTTKDRIHHENQTRVFDIYSDDSEEQTKKVIESNAEAACTGRDDIEGEFKVLRCAQSLLEGKEVLIPFGKKIAEHFPVKKVRARRDFKRVIAMIKSHTLLYQFQRETNSDSCLIATLEDLAGVLPLIEKALEDSQRELTPKQLEILSVIQSDKISIEFSVRDVFTNPQVRTEYKTLQRYFKHFASEGLIGWNGERGQKSRYTKGCSSDVLMSLTGSFVSKIQTLLNNSQNLKDNCDLSSTVSMSSSSESLGHKDNQGHLPHVLNNPNDNGRLESKKGVKDIETRGIEGALPFKNLKHAGSTDPTDWEDEEGEFLSAGEEVKAQPSEGTAKKPGGAEAEDFIDYQCPEEFSE